MLFNPATAPYAEIYLGPFGAAAAALAVEAIAMSVGVNDDLFGVGVGALLATVTSGRLRLFFLGGILPGAEIGLVRL